LVLSDVEHWPAPCELDAAAPANWEQPTHAELTAGTPIFGNHRNAAAVDKGVDTIAARLRETPNKGDVK